MLKFTELYNHSHLEIIIIILYAFSSYLLSEGLRLSGIVAILFCGITMAHYTYPSLSKESQFTTKRLFKVVASLTELSIFTYLGLAIFSFENQEEYSAGLILISIPIIFISRAANIFPLSALQNCCRPAAHKITWEQQIVMWFAGLRGAMAFALSLNVPSPVRQSILTTTLILDLFTILVLGGATIPLLEFLSIPRGKSRSTPERGRDEETFVRKNWFMKLDRTYIMPFFTRKIEESHDERNSVPMMVFHDDESSYDPSRARLEINEDPVNDEPDQELESESIDVGPEVSLIKLPKDNNY